MDTGISELTLKLIIILIPGIIATLIYEKLTVRRDDRDSYRLTVISIVLGFISYGILQVLYYGMCKVVNLYPNEEHLLSVFSSLSDSEDIPYREVLEACGISILLAYIVTAIVHYEIIYKIAKKAKVTDKTSDHNLYSEYLSKKGVEWIYVRDLGKGLVYQGYVKWFNERGDMKELILKDVTVYNGEIEELYPASELYLCFRSDNFMIEKAIIKPKKNEQKNAKVAE